VDNQEAETALKYSIAGRLGTALETFSQWAGFDWRTNIALIGGFAMAFNTLLAFLLAVTVFQVGRFIGF